MILNLNIIFQEFHMSEKWFPISDNRPDSIAISWCLLTAISFLTCILCSHNPLSSQGTYIKRDKITHVCTFHSKSTPRASLVIDLTLLSLCVPCRCDISVCYKPDSSTDWKLRKSQTSAQIQPLNPTFCSLLCLPILTFSGALPWDCWLLVWIVWKERFCALLFICSE